MNLNDQISPVLGLTKNHKDWMYLLQPIEISVGQIRIARDQKRSWHAGPIQMLWVTGSLAFLCVIFLILMQDIHPTPTKLTLQKDAAELARLETGIGFVL
jgi:hypothetical protein